MVLPTGATPADASVDPADGEDAPMPAAVSRLVLGAQEDLRREIARAMHDGPAQSLTNIVLQAQIVERLVVRDPASAAGEVRQLVAMVQHTLDATKSFIFDVRPMVLDDLGLVPTLRRATRERGRRAGHPGGVRIDGSGPTPPDGPRERPVPDARRGAGRVSRSRPRPRHARLDWADQLEARVGATRAVVERGAIVGRRRSPHRSPARSCRPPSPRCSRSDWRIERQAAEAAVRESIVELPAANWREIQGRASSIGVTAELLSDGSELRLVADIPALETPSEE